MTRKRKMAAVMAGAIAGAVITTAATIANAAEVTLRLSHFLPPSSTTQAEFLEPWARRVMEESNGRIEIQIYPSMQLGGKPPQLYNQVKNGVADIVWTVQGYTSGRFPLTEVFELPFVPGSAEATSQALWEFYEKHLQEEYADVKPLLLHTHAPGTLHTRDKLVKTVEDLDGMKIRLPTKPIADALRALGAVPVGMPVPATYEALSRGVVDGALIPFEVATPLKINELTPYHTSTGLYTATFLLAMNKDRYESLPDDLKVVIDRNSGMALAKKIGAIWDKAEQKGIDEAEAMGHEFYTIEGEELERWKKAVQPVIDAWIERADKSGHDGNALYHEALDLVAKYSKE